MSLKVVSGNIEGPYHLARLEPFLRAQQPDVVCFQELLDKNIPFFQGVLGGGHMHYLPQSRYQRPRENHPSPSGLGIWSRHPLEDVLMCDFFGNTTLPEPIDYHHERALFASITHQGRTYRIGTTHVRVTESGVATPEQMEAVSNLLTVAKAQAETHGNLLLTGDFNAPRGRASFQLVADVFHDAIPAHYTTSIDNNLHRAENHIEFVVDGFFHTPDLVAANVKLNGGLSDHMIITAELTHQ